MRVQWLATGLLVVSPALSQTTNAPATSSTPIRPQQAAVYRDFLKDYNRGSKEPLNVANATTPLELSGDEECTKGLNLQALKQAGRTVHRLRREDLPEADATLVDPVEQQELIAQNDPQRLVHRSIDDHDATIGGKAIDASVEAAFKTGLLELSEVAFDESQQYAVMRFSFTCGALCGHGGTLVFKRVKGHWKRQRRSCGSWIS